MNNPSLSKNQAPAVRRIDRLINLFILIGFLSFTLLVCCSCGSTKVVSQTVERISKDTIYLTSQQYDSIYIYKDRSTDYRRGLTETLETSETLKPDTLYIKDVSIEYRYRLLKDTVRLVERDSIPYEVTITEVKEITRPLTWFDYLCRYSFFFLLGIVLYLIYRFICKFI